MYARVATFHTESDPDEVRRGFEEVKRRATSGTRERLPAVGHLDLYKPDEGKVLAITLFDTEEDLRLGDDTLNAMDPPRPGARVRRLSVEIYEVPVKIDV
jgi:hypothetical protein